MILVRSAFGYDGDIVSEETGLSCADPSLAQQHQADEADINTIVKRFGITGVLPQNVRAPQFIDFDEVFDYQSALEAIAAADRSFMSMPAEVRARFNNDPQAFVAFCSDPGNLDEMRKLGLALPVEVKEEKPSE